MDNAIAVAVVDVSIKVAVLAAIAGLATRTAGPDLAAAAHRLWLAVMVSPVVLLVSALAVPPLVLIVPRAHREDGLVTGAATVLFQWGPAIYGVVTSLLLLRLAAGLAEVSRLVRGSVAIRRDGGVDLRACRLRVPVTVGVFRRIILLPANWRDLSGAETSAILAHEHAHVRRGDYAWGLLASVIEACCWFHPAIWFAGRRLRWFAELASDRDAASALGVREYAGELVRLAGRWSEERRALRATMVGASSTLGRRIHLLVDRASDGRSRSRRLFLTTLAVLLLVASSFVVRLTLRGAGLSAPAGYASPASHLLDHRNEHRRTHGH